MQYFKGHFHKSGFWFFCFSLIPSLPWLLVGKNILRDIKFYFSGESYLPSVDLITILSMAIGPIITSYILGGLLGKEIITRSDLSIWSCRFKGGLVAAGGLLSFFLINLIDICLRDYDDGGDFSAERSLNFVLGITAFMCPFALFI